ncbi:MAG TPA: membrane integrity-associated transporter subunit PqiC [Thiotrichaceae bacterium]|nr:membrane integrity-associated transporter subunit PqiC [Thiotrichaceae bacterium]
MIKITFILTLSILICSCSSLGGGGESGKTRFYSISPIIQSGHKTSQLHLGVGPVRIPMLLRRPQIISRIGHNELKISEKHHWAGSLREDITQALLDDIASLTGTPNIEKFPWRRSFKPNYQIRIQLEQLDGQLGGTVTLKARWWLRKENQKKDFLSQHTILQVTTKGNDYTHYVAAQSEAIFQLAKRITQAF